MDEASSEDDDYDPAKEQAVEEERPNKRSRNRFIDDTAEVEDEEARAATHAAESAPLGQAGRGSSPSTQPHPSHWCATW
eukprot:scaffold13792_cov102-Isochrysis_galbana.AAC.2